MTTDLQGVAMVITAAGTGVASILGAWAVIRAGKTQTTAQAAKDSADAAHVSADAGIRATDAAHSTIREVGKEFNGRMTQLMDTKDRLTEARVDGASAAGIEQGKLIQKAEDHTNGK